MPTFRCARFPTGLAKIRTTRGIVEFRDGVAEVDDEETAAALREVPDVFGISEAEGEDLPEGAGPPVRPGRTATKPAWVKYVVATVAVSEQQAKAMTKDQLIELAG